MQPDITNPYPFSLSCGQLGVRVKGSTTSDVICNTATSSPNLPMKTSTPVAILSAATPVILPQVNSTTGVPSLVFLTQSKATAAPASHYYNGTLNCFSVAIALAVPVHGTEVKNIIMPVFFCRDGCTPHHCIYSADPLFCTDFQIGRRPVFEALEETNHPSRYEALRACLVMLFSGFYVLTRCHNSTF